jgi:hypothetical protein
VAEVSHVQDLGLREPQFTVTSLPITLLVLPDQDNSSTINADIFGFSLFQPRTGIRACYCIRCRSDSQLDNQARSYLPVVL